MPLFVSVTDCSPLVVLTFWLEKVRRLTESVTTGPTPFPMSETICGLLGALSVTKMRPVRLPLAVGLKVMVMMQFALTARVEPQLLVWT